MKIGAYIVTIMIAILPIVAFFQSLMAIVIVAVLPIKGEESVSARIWTMKGTAFITALAAWFGVNELWTIAVGQQMPRVLSGIVYVSITIATKATANQMNEGYRMYRLNEIYATLIFFIYMLFFSNANWF